MAKLVVCRSQVPILVSETSREDAGLGQCGWDPQGVNSGLASAPIQAGPLNQCSMETRVS